jgi:hypothetical protein
MTGRRISAEGAIIPFRDSSGVGDWSVALDLSGGQRLAESRDFQNLLAIFVSDVVYNFRKDVTLGFLSTVRTRDYNDYFGQYRRDNFVAFQARIELTPEWLTKRLPDAEIDLSVSYQRNASTLPTLSYSRWQGGPALIVTQRF